MKNVNQNEKFVKCSSRLTLEAWLKSALIALAIGFSVAFVLSTVTWFTEFNSLWLSLGLFGGISIVATVVLYFSVFRPTVQKNAKRIDRLGLEERMITMVEYENDDSYIARRQREDAQAHLAAVNAQELKIKVSKKITIPFATSAVLGIGMTTISTLAAFGIIFSGIELLDPILPDEPIEYAIIEYVVEEGGYISGGDELQEVIIGESADEVIAVADDGWMFIGWDDGVKTPNREDSKVNADRVVFAIFMPTDENGSPMMDGDGGKPQNKPGDDPTNNGDQPGEVGNNGDAGGKYDYGNMVYDGDTDYTLVYDESRSDAETQMSESEGEISTEAGDVVSGYYDILG